MPHEHPAKPKSQCALALESLGQNQAGSAAHPEQGLPLAPELLHRPLPSLRPSRRSVARRLTRVSARVLARTVSLWAAPRAGYRAGHVAKLSFALPAWRVLSLKLYAAALYFRVGWGDFLSN